MDIKILTDEESNAALSFIRALFKGYPDLDIQDEFELQDLAVKHGILVGHKPTAPCGVCCNCDEYYSEKDWGQGWIVCYRLAEWVKVNDLKVTSHPAKIGETFTRPEFPVVDEE